MNLLAFLVTVATACAKRAGAAASRRREPVRAIALEWLAQSFECTHTLCLRTSATHVADTALSPYARGRMGWSQLYCALWFAVSAVLSLVGTLLMKYMVVSGKLTDKKLSLVNQSGMVRAWYKLRYCCYCQYDMFSPYARECTLIF